MFTAATAEEKAGNLWKALKMGDDGLGEVDRAKLNILNDLYDPEHRRISLADLRVEITTSGPDNHYTTKQYYLEGRDEPVMIMESSDKKLREYNQWGRKEGRDRIVDGRRSLRGAINFTPPQSTIYFISPAQNNEGDYYIAATMDIGYVFSDIPRYQDSYASTNEINDSTLSDVRWFQTRAERSGEKEYTAPEMLPYVKTISQYAEHPTQGKRPRTGEDIRRARSKQLRAEQAYKAAVRAGLMPEEFAPASSAADGIDEYELENAYAIIEAYELADEEALEQFDADELENAYALIDAYERVYADISIDPFDDTVRDIIDAVMAEVETAEPVEQVEASDSAGQSAEDAGALSFAMHKRIERQVFRAPLLSEYNIVGESETDFLLANRQKKQQNVDAGQRPMRKRPNPRPDDHAMAIRARDRKADSMLADLKEQWLGPLTAEKRAEILSYDTGSTEEALLHCIMGGVVDEVMLDDSNARY